VLLDAPPPPPPPPPFGAVLLLLQAASVASARVNPIAVPCARILHPSEVDLGLVRAGGYRPATFGPVPFVCRDTQQLHPCRGVWDERLLRRGQRLAVGRRLAGCAGRGPRVEICPLSRPECSQADSTGAGAPVERGNGEEGGERTEGVTAADGRQQADGPPASVHLPLGSCGHILAAVDTRRAR
jgi:hypothetical protein